MKRRALVCIYREIILSDNSHHTELRPFRVVTAISLALAAIPFDHESECVQFILLQFALMFYSQYIKKAQGVFSLVSQRRFTSNRHVFSLKVEVL